MGHGSTVEHDDDAVGRCPADRKRNAHHEDARIGSANALTLCRGRRGGVRGKENKRLWMFIPEQMGALDALASSSNPQKLLDNEIHCPQRKIVSKQ
jgi:hypothetical protein